MKTQDSIQLQKGDALISVDVQNDFLPGGSLAVPQGDQVVPVMNQYICMFEEKGLPVFATRDWHPADHCSFKEQGGPWPPHCVQGSKGAEFPSELQLPEDTVVISSATKPEKEAYSGFEGTDLDDRLKAINVKRLFIGGIATDYCVLNTVKDALSLDYEVYLLEDAIRSVNVKSDDGEKAKAEMIGLGAKPISIKNVR